MARRAERVDATRQRIIEATVGLHTSIGPAATTVAGIAKAAGVTRLTVYRHFPDPGALFAACQAHWRRAHPPPDPARWEASRDLHERALLGLSELYAWYRANDADLTSIYRDAGSMPAASRAEVEATEEWLAMALVSSHVEGRVRRRLMAVARHLVSFETWASLTAESRLDDAEAAEIGADLLRVAAAPAPRRPERRRRAGAAVDVVS